MKKIYKFLNYNWLKIFKTNIKNNKTIELKSKEKKETNNLIFKKEICALIFVIINFLITYTSSIEMYKMNYENNILMHILKDNIHISIIWFILLTILPIISSIMISKKIKSKHYLIQLILYFISNLFNISLLIYFITEFINNILLGVIGIINIIITLLININIIIKLKENYLK